MRILPKNVIFYSKKKVRFDCKKNYKHSKLANFRLDIISSINYRTIYVLYLIKIKVEKCPIG